MLIKCPQCQTVYRLESEKLPENGLKMRCAKCRCVWRAYNDAVKEEEKEKTSADAPSFDTDAFRFAFSREEKEERTPPDDRQEATARRHARRHPLPSAATEKNTGASACPARGSRRRRPRLAFPRTNRTTAGKSPPLTEQTIAPLLQKAIRCCKRPAHFSNDLEDAIPRTGTEPEN